MKVFKEHRNDFIDIEDILRDLKADYESFNLPETFEELKELCKKLEPKLVKENSLYETQITLNINKGGYYAFYPDGTIIFKASNSINYTIAKNRTMSQMFQFIKSLIGEE
jgi:ABC-type glycerol-3-phosphate transport system substrate-binding protein